MLEGARIFHVNVNCSDLARSRAYYVDACGLVEGVHTAPERTQPGTAFALDRARWDAVILVGARGFDGGAVDLLEWQEPLPTGAPPGTLLETGWQRVGMTVADLDAALARVEHCGGTTWRGSDVHHVPRGSDVRIAFVGDPDGTAIELVEGTNTGLSFVSVVCRDLERSVAFYGALGFTERARFPSARADGARLRIDGPLAMVEVLMHPPGGGDVNLILVSFEQPAARSGARRPANSLGIWRSALLLPDLDPAVAALRSADVELLSDPQAMSMGPGLPDLRFVCFRGPDDEVVELIEQPTL